MEETVRLSIPGMNNGRNFVNSMRACLRHAVLGAMLLWGFSGGIAHAEDAFPSPVLLTNLHQLRNATESTQRVIHPFRIDAQVVGLDLTNGVMALRDSSCVEFIQAGIQGKDIAVGATIRMEGTGLAVMPRQFGLALAPAMLVDNDGNHASVTESGTIFLKAGFVPVALKWYNALQECELTLEYEGPGIRRRKIPGSALFHGPVNEGTSQSNFAAGINYRCFEGYWERIPEFSQLQQVKSGVATNFDIGVRTRPDCVAMEFSGYISIPTDGAYTFHLRSDDGSQLFIGGSSLDIRVLDHATAVSNGETNPAATLESDTWMTLEGTVAYTGIWNSGGEMLVRVGNDEIRVQVFESGGVVPVIPPRSRVSIIGLYQDAVIGERSHVPGRMLVLTWKDIRVLSASDPHRGPKAGKTASNPEKRVDSSPDTGRDTITTVADVKALTSGAARERIPVSIRGVVTDYRSRYRGAVVQDSTGGVFVELQQLKGGETLQRGEYCQIDGVSGPGWFAPVVVADRIRHFGPGQMPKPMKVSGDQLVSGNIDTEYAEIDGIVTWVQGNRIVLRTEGGKIALDLFDFRPEIVQGLENALVRIRGCFYASFVAETHKIGKGSLVVSGAVVDILEPAPRDIFDAPGRNIDELLLFDPKPAPFRRQKIGGQIICARQNEYYINDGTNGVRVTARTNTVFKVGDNVDVVGFLDLNGPVLELSEAAMRKTGHAGLRPPLKLDSQRLLQAGNAGMRVQVEATLVNRWRDGNQQVYVLQAGYLMFKSRTSVGTFKWDPPPLGSKLEITGTYAPIGRGADDGTVAGFELLMNSPAEAHIVEKPPWWNLKRLLAAVGSLGLLLIGVLAWNRQLHGQVRERTRKLEQEIHNRQRAEMQRVAESERSRIARDLHDELGTGLTEVSLLASAGLGRIHEEGRILDRFHAIAEKARNLVSGLDVIVWAIDPKRNSLRSFADYLADYANELFSSHVVGCQLKVRIECGDVAFSETTRHSLFLAAKEALNNIIKHSSATEAELRIAQQGSELHIIIADNGRGFDWKTIRNGNGLGNLRERLKMINGECRIDSQPGAGTTVKFRVPIECLKNNEESL